MLDHRRPLRGRVPVDERSRDAEIPRQVGQDIPAIPDPGTTRRAISSQGNASGQIRVLHFASGDGWAGAEVMLRDLVRAQVEGGETEVAVAVLNDGILAKELTGFARVEILPEEALTAPRLLGAASRLVRAFRPDIVHTHGMKLDVIGALATTGAPGTSCIRTVHGAEERAYHGATVRSRLRTSAHRLIVARCIDLSVAVSAQLAAALGAEYGHARVACIPNGMAQRATTGRVRDPSGTGPLRIGIVGRLVPVKRIELFLAIAARLRDESPGAFRFVIVGDGPERARLELLGNELALNDCVEFVGFVRDAQAVIAGLDALVLTSDSEGLPMVVLEAASEGTPVISHDVGAIGEVLGGDAGGWLIPSQDPEDYVAVLRRLLTRKEEFEYRALAARRRVRETFSAEAMATRYTTEYRRLMEARNSPGPRMASVGRSGS